MHVSARLTPLCGVLIIALAVAPAALADFPYNPPYDFDWDWAPDITVPDELISPLCGDVLEVAPAGWSLGDDCPESQWETPDRIVSTYGPRQQSDDFDFHRGLDFRTSEMEEDNEDEDEPIESARPVFAVADGELVEVEDDGDNGWLVVIAHRALGAYTRYKHLSEVDTNISGLSVNDSISAGQYLGMTGRSASGNHHLHFEVRKVTPDGDSSVTDEHTESSWQRNAVHPLRLVPYDTTGTTTTLSVSRDTGGTPVVDLTTDRWGVTRVAIDVCEDIGGDCDYPDPAPNSARNDGYFENAPFFDFEHSCYEYTHRGASRWSTFESGGGDECPYVSAHGSSYSGSYHLDEGNTSERTFNGVTTEVFGSSTQYHRIFDFDAVTTASDGCARATVTFVNGDAEQSTYCW